LLLRYSALANDWASRESREGGSHGRDHQPSLTGKTITTDPFRMQAALQLQSGPIVEPFRQPAAGWKNELVGEADAVRNARYRLFQEALELLDGIRSEADDRVAASPHLAQKPSSCVIAASRTKVSLLSASTAPIAPATGGL